MPELKITAAGSGSTTLTISAAEGTNYTKPANKTISLSSSYAPLPAVGTDTKTLTAAQWKQIVDAGAAPELLPVGSLTPLIPFNGTVAEQSFDLNIRCRVVHMDGTHPVLQIARNEAGREIALVHAATWFKYIEADGSGFCMNRKGQVGGTIDSSLTEDEQNMGTSKGGWRESYCRNTLMPGIIACFPKEWRNIMRASTIWTDNAGRGTNIASNVTSTLDKMYLPGVMEIFGSYGYANDATATKDVHFDWYKAGNMPVVYCHVQPTTVHGLSNPAKTAQWLRDPYRILAMGFCWIGDDMKMGYFYAGQSNGLRPCFSI